MGNSNLSIYVNRFFDELEIYEDVKRGHLYKSYIRSCVGKLLQKESPENAFDVYKAFFDSYRIDIPGETNPFTDIILLLEEYEKTAASLIDSQRDHFVHAVNVFLTGLAVYIQNENYRKSFSKAILESDYQFYYKTRHEEFFYRWALASLLHDIGYPIEIAGNQLNRFLRIVCDADGEDISTKAEISYSNFDELNCVKQINDYQAFSDCFFKAYPFLKNVDPSKPVDLMAHRICQSLGTEYEMTKAGLDGFTEAMAKSGFIDHGYFSSLILLKWYGALIQIKAFKPEYFFWPVLDSATAILLHNYFKNVIRKAPYNHAPMKAVQNPIAFLLIFCDEAQEWNRTARGIKTRKKVLADSVNFSIENDYLAVSYISSKPMEEGFAAERKETFLKLLDLNDIFANSINVDCIAASSLLFDDKTVTAARPLLCNVERLAIAIHMKYNEKRLKDCPGEELLYPDFSALPDDLKYSNMRQAMSIYDKLSLIGCTLSENSDEYVLSKNEIEFLAEKEHEDWMRERIESGWTLGEKDVINKKSPYLVPYEMLSEDIKEYDRYTIRNIPELAAMIGLRISRLK